MVLFGCGKLRKNLPQLFVLPDASGKGVGTQLLINSLEKMGRPARLKCVSKNHRALIFYEKNGWKKVVEEEKAGEKYWVLVYNHI